MMLKFLYLFNLLISRREKRNIPFIISACVREVERRGIHEVGVYRVSGSASDLNRLKKSFETSTYGRTDLLIRRVMYSFADFYIGTRIT